MDRYLGRIVVNEMPDLVMRNAPELRPCPQRADRRFLADGKNPALAQSNHIGELTRE